jgi:hypothetical protein
LSKATDHDSLSYVIAQLKRAKPENSMELHAPKSNIRKQHKKNAAITRVAIAI